MKENQIKTSYCGQTHRIIDGKPVQHKCVIIPQAALIAESNGDKVKMQNELNMWKNKRPLNGLKG
jgi:hypothetical protein